MTASLDDRRSEGAPRRSSRIEFIDRYLALKERRKFTALLVGQVDAFNRVSSTFGSERANAFFADYIEDVRAILPPGSAVLRLSERRFAALIRIEAMGGLIDAAADLTERNTPKLMVGDDALLVDVTIGAAVHPTHASNGSNLFRRAELALSEARRNELMFEIYRTDATQQQAALWKFASDLEKAIQNSEFELHMQPKVRMADGATVGAEALVRWRQASGQVVLPSDFVPLAEQSGSIIPMTWQIFEKIATNVEQWTIEVSDFTMAVNVSAQVMDNVEFLSKAQELQRRLQARNVKLQVELTEESLVEDFNKIRKKADRLRDLGIGLAIDDFGKGYSSLTYLKDIPATEIKIDKKFVERIAIDDKDFHIVKAVMDLAQAFGMRVVAEGVDNDESLRVLSDLGVEYAQGFYISRPMRSEQFEDWFRSSSVKPLQLAVAGEE